MFLTLITIAAISQSAKTNPFPCQRQEPQPVNLNPVVELSGRQEPQEPQEPQGSRRSRRSRRSRFRHVSPTSRRRRIPAFEFSLYCVISLSRDFSKLLFTGHLRKLCRILSSRAAPI